MSGKKPSSLRNALREMRVNEPLRLSKSGPSFKPPEAITSKQNEVPLQEVPLSEAAPHGAAPFSPSRGEEPPAQVPQSEAAHRDVTKNEVTQNERTQVEHSRNEEPKTEQPRTDVPQNKIAENDNARFEHTQIEKTRSEVPRTEHSRNELARTEQAPSVAPQNENAQKEEARNEQPQNQATHHQHAQNKPPRSDLTQKEPAKSEAPQSERPKNGSSQNEPSTSSKVAQIDPPQIEQASKAFFRLSDRAFSYPQLQNLSGDCFRLFLWMSSRGWRFQNSDGTLRASVGFIEDNTAMSHATISRCLKTLRETALIELLETDYKRGNVWSISPLAFAGCAAGDVPPRSEGPQKEASRKEELGTSKRDRSHLNLREKAPQNEEHIRSNNKSKKLSQEGAELLFERIEKIRAPEKQRTEREGLLQLLETHKCEEVTTALAYIEKYGTLSGESCHSPFRYLATAIDDVLETCLRKGIKPATSSVAVSKQEEAKAEEEARALDSKRKAAFERFERELSAAEQEQFVSSYVAKEFKFGYQPSNSLAVRLAAVAWFEQQQAREAST